MRKQRLEHIEFEMTLGGGVRNRGMIAEYLAAYHGERLALGWIDLARHDVGAGFVLRQDQFAYPRSRSGAEQADVAGDLKQIGGQRIERAVGERVSPVRSKRLKFVRRALEGQARDRG